MPSRLEKEKLSILVIDPEKDDHALIRDSFLRSELPASLRFVHTTDEGLSTVDGQAFDLVMTDHALPDANAFHFLFEVRRRGLALPVLLLTRNGEARVAREAFHRGADDFLLKEDLESICLFEVVGNLIEKKRLEEEQAREANRLREQAERDGLTGLFNRRYFGEALEKEFERARRYRRDLSLMMIDLDGFKAVNDSCGHPQGDIVLKLISRLILQSMRFVDIATRYGGDEFAVILPETNLKSALRTAKRLLKEIRKSPFLHEEKVYPLSASLGVVSLDSHHTSAQNFLHEADEALYRAKRQGRDQVVSGRLEQIMRGDEEPAEVPVGVVEIRDDMD